MKIAVLMFCDHNISNTNHKTNCFNTRTIPYELKSLWLPIKRNLIDLASRRIRYFNALLNTILKLLTLTIQTVFTYTSILDRTTIPSGFKLRRWCIFVYVVFSKGFTLCILQTAIKAPWAIYAQDEHPLTVYVHTIMMAAAATTTMTMTMIIIIVIGIVVVGVIVTISRFN